MFRFNVTCSIKIFLILFLGIACVTSDNRHWLEDNFGYFRFQASIMDFLSLKNDFRGVSFTLLCLNNIYKLS